MIKASVSNLGIVFKNTKTNIRNSKTVFNPFAELSANKRDQIVQYIKSTHDVIFLNYYL